MFHSRNKVSCIYVLQTNEIKTFMEVSKQLLNFHFFWVNYPFKTTHTNLSFLKFMQFGAIQLKTVALSRHETTCKIRTVYHLVWSPKDKCLHHWTFVSHHFPNFLSRLSRRIVYIYIYIYNIYFWLILPLECFIHCLYVFWSSDIFFYTDLKQPSAPSPNTAAHSLYLMISTSAHSHPSSVVYFNIAFNIHSTKSLS